jgi:hypothetical protein
MLWSIPLALVAIVPDQAYAEQRGTRGLDLWCPGECPLWYINLNDYGYSDWLIYWHHVGVYPHEMLSGEWAAAIRYEGIDTWPNAMWLTPYFICPDWITNSNFLVSTPIQYLFPPEESEVESSIHNDQVRIRIHSKMYCSKTAMGITPGPGGTAVESDSCFMVQNYWIVNKTANPINDVMFYQFLHGHPGDRYDPVVFGVYDSDFYSIVDPEFPASEDYHYDITQWCDRAFLGIDYTEYIGFGGIEEPTAYDLWHYRNPNPDNTGPYGCDGGRPPDGLHVRVENDALAGTISYGPDQTAGAEKWYLGSIPAFDSVLVSVLLSVASDPVLIWGEPEFEPDPAHIYYKYAFHPMSATVYMGNFEDPYTAEDVASAEVNGISATIVGILESHPGYDGSVVQLEIPIAPFLEDYGAPLDTVIDYFVVSGQFTDSESYAGAGEVGLIGKSSTSGGRQWILPPNEILLHGDVDASGNIDIDDVVNTIAVIFSGGSVAGPFLIADCNCSHSVDIDDAIYLISYIFTAGPFPCHE